MPHSVKEVGFRLTLGELLLLLFWTSVAVLFGLPCLALCLVEAYCNLRNFQMSVFKQAQKLID